MTHPPARAGAIARTTPAQRRIRLALGGLLGMGILAGAAVAAFAAEGEQIIETHGYSTFGSVELPADFEHLPYVNPDAPKGGEISVSTIGTFDSMNPYATLSGSPGALASIGYERILTGVQSDASGSYCLLCTTMEYPESEDWVIFNLRPEARFSDGTPLTAHDIIFSHELLREQGTPSLSEYLGQVIESAEALDDHRVKFTFAEGIPRKNLIIQVGNTPAWSKAWYEETGARLDESRMEISPGSGPYMVGEVDPGRSITYTRNPDYWGRDLPIMRGRANFDEIRVEYFGDSASAFEAFTAGVFTFRRENSSINWATRYDFPALDEGWVVRETLSNGLIPGALGFVFNLRNPELQDPRVREALGLMFNFTWTNNTLQYGLFEQRESFWQGSELAASGVPEGRELEMLQEVSDLINPAILTEAVVMPHVSGERQLDRGNLRRALALMEEAGYAVGDDGLLRKDGQTLSIEFLETRQSFDRILTPYIDNLKRLGVDITYDRVDPAQYQARTQEFDWDMIYGGYSTGLEEGTGLDQRFGSDGLGDVFNPSGYASPAVDALIDKVIDAETYDEMAAGVRAIDRIMRAERFLIPSWYTSTFWVAYFDIYDYPEERPRYASGPGHLDYWWFDQEAYDRLSAEGAL